MEELEETNPNVSSSVTTVSKGTEISVSETESPVPSNLFLADRIKKTREKQNAGGSARRLSEDRKTDNGATNVYDIVSVYKNMLHEESKLSHSVMTAISEAKYFNQNVEIPRSDRSSRNSKSRSSSISLKNHPRRRIIFDDSGVSVSSRNSRRTDKVRSSKSRSSGTSSVETLTLPALSTTPNQLHLHGNSESSLKHNGKPLMRRNADSSEAHRNGGSSQSVRCQTGQDSASDIPTSEGNSLYDDCQYITETPMPFTRSTDINIFSRASQGDKTSWEHTARKELMKPRKDTPSFMLYHLLDVTDNSYGEVLESFSSKTKSVSVGTQTFGEVYRPLKLADLIVKYKNVSTISERGPFPGEDNNQPTHLLQPTVPAQTTARCYRFLGTHFQRSLSMPSISEKTISTRPLRQRYDETDMDDILFPDNHYTDYDLTKSSPYRLSKQPNTKTKSSLEKQVYLRSGSCRPPERNKDFKSSRMSKLYTNIKKIEKLCQSDTPIKMTVSGRCGDVLTASLTLGRCNEELCLYKHCHCNLSPRGFPPAKTNKALDFKKTRSTRRKPFIYMEDTSLKHVTQSATDSKMDRFLGRDSKDSVNRISGKLEGSRITKIPITKDTLRQLHEQTKHHFVPWK